MIGTTPSATPATEVAATNDATHDPLEAVQEALASITAPLRELVAAQLSRLRVSIRLAIVRALAALALLVTCVALLFGAAVYAGLAVAAGVTAATGQPWLGYLAAAMLMFGMGVLGLWSMIPRAVPAHRTPDAPQPGSAMETPKP